MMRHVVVAALFAGVLLPASRANAQPPQGEIVLNNESARVTLFAFRPGGGTGRHSWLEPELGIVAEGELLLITPEGQQALRAGQAYWIPGLVPHDIRNESPGIGKLWDVILKRCQ